MTKRQLAFTLIELLVVIAIIGILSGLIVAGMSGAVNSAKIAKSKVFATSLRDALLGNLVSEWKFDGTTADGSPATNNDVLDTWNHTNNGDVGAHQPTVKTGSNCVSGSCLQFDGTDDYVDCGSGSSLNITDAITISAWVKRGAISSGSTAYTVVRKGGQTNIVLDYCLVFGTGNNLNFGASKTTTTISSIASSDAITSTTNWYYFVGTFDGTNRKLYINGVLVNVSGGASSNTNVSNFYIGQKSDGTQLFNGLIDDVRIYNAAMPTSQIKENYYAGLNKLLAKNELTIKEYKDRVADIK